MEGSGENVEANNVDMGGKHRSPDRAKPSRQPRTCDPL